jgi:DNA-binding CsgD family transcriptional regulator
MPDAPADQRLSERERAVLRLLADGCAGQAAAARLGISDSTVRSYIGRACAKLGATTREQLMVLATRQWDNPYQVPQLSYNKVKSFVTTTGAGSYAPPTGTVQALTWTYVPGCYTFNFSFAYDRVTFGSRWDAFFGYYETTWWHFLP